MRYGEIIERLGDCDRQVERVITRHRYLCPKCGKECNAKHHYVKGKDIDCSDIEISCIVCGKTLVEVESNGKKKITTLKGSREKCIIRSNIVALKKRLQKNDYANIDELVDVCDRIATESRYSEENVDLVSLYCKEMQALLDYCKTNSGDKIICLCEHTLDCNSIEKLELLNIMREVYRYIEQNKELVPPALFLHIYAERSMLEYAFNRMFYDPEDYLWQLDWCAEKYAELQTDEFMKYPFTPHNAYKYATNMARNGGEEKLAKKYSKKDMKSIEESVAKGAKLTNNVAESYVALVSQTSDNNSKVIEKLDGNMKKMKTDPCYVAFASGYSVYSLFETIAEKVTKDSIRNIEDDMRDKIVGCANRCIDAAEQLDDVGGLAFFLTLSYLVRGMLTDRMEDLEKAVDYAILFSNHGLIKGIWMESLSRAVYDYFDEKDPLSVRFERNVRDWFLTMLF